MKNIREYCTIVQLFCKSESGSKYNNLKIKKKQVSLVLQHVLFNLIHPKCYHFDMHSFQNYFNEILTFLVTVLK